jgi:hypothetical protein
MLSRTIILCVLNCITGTIQVIEGQKYFLRRPNVRQPYPSSWLSHRQLPSQEETLSMDLVSNTYVLQQYALKG